MDSNSLPSVPPPETGSETVDAEHGIQLGLLYAALDALSTGADNAPELVEQFYTYSQAHFLSEQLLMRLAARANYEGHVQEHESLLQQLDVVREQTLRNEAADAEESLRAHEKHLLDHIRSWDQSVE